MRLPSPSPPNHHLLSLSLFLFLFLLLVQPSWAKNLRGGDGLEGVNRRQQAPPVIPSPEEGNGASTRGVLPPNTTTRAGPLILTDVEYAMFEAINNYRADRGVAEVCINRRLQAAARDTVDRALECGDHATNLNTLCDGSTAEDRVTEAGYPLDENYFQALVLYMGGCKQGPQGCGKKAIKNWYNGGSTQDRLLDDSVVHLGISGSNGDGTSWYYSLFYGSASGQKCVHVQPETPQGQDDGGYRRRRSLLVAVEEEEG